MRTRALWLIIAACAFWLPASSPASSSPSFPDRYDTEIERAAERWLPGMPWRMWKGQLAAESGLDPAAVSPVGAAGLAQMMPGTWREVREAMGWGLVSPHDVRYAVEGGAFYLARLIRFWSSPRPVEDKWKLGQASYNSGAGNILRAQRACGNPVLYDEIVRCLPQVTGRFAQETLSYVPRIWRLWARFEVER